MTSLLDLPTDVIGNIYDNLNIKDKIKLRSTNTVLKNDFNDLH